MAALCPLEGPPVTTRLRLLGFLTFALTALAASDLAAQQVPADSVADAIAGGRLSLELRPRYADIWDAGVNERGHAWTMRGLADRNLRGFTRRGGGHPHRCG